MRLFAIHEMEKTKIEILKTDSFFRRYDMGLDKHKGSESLPRGIKVS